MNPAKTQRRLLPNHSGVRSQAVRNYLGPCGGMATKPLVELIASASVLSGTTTPIDTTGASLLVACYAHTAVVATFTDNQLNVWTPTHIQQGGGAGLLYLHTVYAWNPVTSDNHTFTITGAYVPVVIGAWKGIAISSDPLDQTNGAAYSSATQPPWTPGTIVTATSEELVVSSFGVYGPSDDIFIHSPFNLLDVSMPGVTDTNWGIYMAYTIQKLAGSVTATWGMDILTPVGYDCAFTIASFRNRREG